MGLEARLLLGHCSPRLSALSGPSRIGPTDHFEGIRASHIKGQTLVEMAGTHHRSHIMENVTLTPKEQSRLQVLNSLAAEHMTLDQAAELMGVTSRHTRRILAAYRERGAAALAHSHRGRRPVNATPEALVVDVAQLARTRYAGVNHTHLAELLAEREGIHLGRTTLRRVLLDAGLSSPRRRRPPKHRVRRQRMPQEGMLIQMDGSYHPWLGDQAPPFTLLIAVDDATGQVVSAWFCEHEDARSYFLLIRALVEHHGLPVALYTDRHAVFKHTPGPGLPAGPTQFSRAMDELGTQMIFAQSPQAKGRVERTGGTFQDRLVAELRLAGATTLEQAQAVLDEFVPRFNRRFGVPPAVLRASVPTAGPGAMPGTGSVFQAPQEGGPGQHGAVPVADTPTAAGAGTPQLCRGDGGSPGRAGWSAQGTPRGTHHRCSGGPAKPGIPPQRPPASRRLSGCAHRGKPLG